MTIVEARRIVESALDKYNRATGRKATTNHLNQKIVDAFLLTEGVEMVMQVHWDGNADVRNIRTGKKFSKYVMGRGW